MFKNQYNDRKKVLKRGIAHKVERLVSSAMGSRIELIFLFNTHKKVILEEQ